MGNSKHKFSTYLLVFLLFLVVGVFCVSSIDGFGTKNYIPKFINGEVITNSSLMDDGENVTISGSPICTRDNGLCVGGNTSSSNISAFGVPPYLYGENNISLNISWFLGYFLHDESDPVFLSNNVSIWEAINSKIDNIPIPLVLGDDFNTSSEDINFPEVSLILNGDDSVGKGVVYALNNKSIVDMSTYQNENMFFFYDKYWYRTGLTAMTYSESGRAGLNKQDNIIENQYFANTTNPKYDKVLTIGGTYTYETPTEYLLQMINSTQVGLRQSVNGAPMSNYVSNWTIVPYQNVTIDGAILVSFNETNITAGTSWYFIAQPQVPQATLSIHPANLQYVFFYNVSNGFIDRTVASSTSTQGSVYQSSFRGLDRNSSLLYVGRGSPFRSVYITVQTAGVGVNRTIFFCNSSAQFQQLLNFTDGTINLTTSGALSYDISRFNWTNLCVVNGVSGMYWLMFNSTSQVTTSPLISGISTQAVSRLRAYAMSGDVIPSLDYDPVTNIFNVTTSRIYSGGLTSSSSISAVGVAVGGALTGATTGAFSGAVSMAGLTATTIANSGTQTSTIINTLNNLNIYGHIFASNSSTSNVPVFGSPLLSFRTNIWNGTTATIQEFNFGTQGNNLTKETNLILFNRNNNGINTTIFNISRHINNSINTIYFDYGNETIIRIRAADNNSQRMCLNVSQSGTVNAFKC